MTPFFPLIIELSTSIFPTPLDGARGRADNLFERSMRVWIEFDRKLFIKNSFYLILFGFSRRKYFLQRDSQIILPKTHKITGPFYCTRFVLLDFVLGFDTGPRLRMVKHGRRKAEGLRAGGDVRKVEHDGESGRAASGILGPSNPRP
jgi:hypothetical protein